ncbi:iron chelate uptake ABC transporter family permease subunit [Mesorhizobium sp. M1312]|uniref:iron chelate uptake ABC transporter family permease subunit n=1 Tax=unclassified Mesorhizobium TaxID=325217 RepID=UPI0033358DC8
MAAFLLLRPLRLLDLSDEGAESLGTKPVVTRLAGITVAVALSSMVVAAVGVISFVALAAPALVRLAGARTLRQRMIWAPLTGAALLWLTDRLVQVLPFTSEIPAGVATAFLGAPLLFLLLPKLPPARIGTAPWCLPCAGAAGGSICWSGSSRWRFFSAPRLLSGEARPAGTWPRPPNLPTSCRSGRLASSSRFALV